MYEMPGQPVPGEKLNPIPGRLVALEDKYGLPYMIMFIPTDQLKETKSALRDANRRLTDLEALRSQLEAERDNLASALHDAEEALKELEVKYVATQNALQHLKTEMEQRLREKDDELENLRSVGHSKSNSIGCDSSLEHRKPILASTSDRFRLIES